MTRDRGSSHGSMPERSSRNPATIRANTRETDGRAATRNRARVKGAGGRARDTHGERYLATGRRGRQPPIRFIPARKVVPSPVVVGITISRIESTPRRTPAGVRCRDVTDTRHTQPRALATTAARHGPSAGAACFRGTRRNGVS